MPDRNIDLPQNFAVGTPDDNDAEWEVYRHPTTLVYSWKRGGGAIAVGDNAATTAAIATAQATADQAQAEVDAAELLIAQLQANPEVTQVELDAAIAAAQAANDALDAAKAAVDAAQDATVAAKADQPALDAEIAARTAHENTAALHVLPGGTALQLYRKTADNSGYEWADITISSSNTVSGPGAPGAGTGVTENGYYYQQLDAALGTNDIWGPSVAGTPATWPAQADFKSADPELLSNTDVTSTTGAPYTKYGVISTERMDEWGRSRRMRRVFNHPGPGDFDFTGLGYPDRTAIFVRNVSSTNGINIVYGVGGANTLEITHADGVTQTIAAQNAINIQPSEIAVIEKDGTNIYVSVFPGERVSYFESYSAANTAPTTPHDGLVVIRDTGEIFGRKTNFNSRVFPADGKPNVDWFKLGDTHTHEVLENIAVHVRSGGTNAGSSVDIELLIDGTWNPTDWVVSTTPVTGLESYTAHPPVFKDREPITGPIGISHNKDGWLFFEYVGDATEGELTGVNYTGANDANSDGEIIVNFAGTNDSVSFAGKADVTATPWEIAESSVGLPVEQRADNESSVVGKTNLRYQDDTIGAVPAVILGQEYADSTVPVNRGDTPGPGIEANSVVYLGTDIGNGPEWVVVQGGAISPKNALVFPVGSFTALSVNDSGTGDDGAVYRLPNIDALVVTLPNKADMNAVEGIYRVRISGDWAALSAQPTVLSFTHDATTVEFSDGLPTDSNEWVDIVFDAANDKWIATSGGEVTLNQIIPSYDNHADVPTNVRVYLATGTGVAAEGLWRKETVGDAPNFIG